MVWPCSSSETSTAQFEQPVCELSLGVAQNSVRAPSPLIGHEILNSESRSNATTPLIWLESAPDRLVRRAQSEHARQRLEGHIVTNTPLSTLFIPSSSGKSGDDDKPSSAPGFEFEGAQTTFDSHEETTLPSFKFLASRASSSPLTQTTGESATEQDHIRSSHFADTLARIEGQIPPNLSSPIQRYVDPEGGYNDNFVLEHFSPIIRCPRPMSWANRLRMRKLLQVGTADGFAELELPESAEQDELKERPANPTPTRATFHNETTSV